MLTGTHAAVPFLTVVMPVRNEARFIRDTLGQLLAQDYPADRYEIIVADGMSDDGTRAIVGELARSCPQIRLMDNPGRRSSAGRNIGFKNGRGDIFLVVDGHCHIPDADLFTSVRECFEKSGADCLGRPQPLNPPGLAPFQQAVALARGSRIGHGGDSLIYGEYEGFASPVSNGAAYRRAILPRVGLVDENFDACEDLEFNYRVEKAGLKTYTSPKLTVRYYPREDLKGLLRQMVRYGRGRWRFIRKHPEAVTLNQLVPAAFVAGLLLLLAAGGTMGFSGGGRHAVTPVLGTLYGIYLLIIMVESLRIAARNGWRYFAYLPPIFFAVHFGLGWGFLRQAVSRERDEVKHSLGT
ncbi:glycosyltransferase family 2 protein [Geobacter sp. FeAm09]|uniref:glycosyltransferase family 2 protein n=1 Tax=Geobacter sp. FeAm09 TaxID=2597769 RepID=UPI0011EC7DD7|nr:glycosyltransferase family 2 protein [Geobacter sp. FeAm09]QEM68667.1 glycosyltransferase family 2 protein [Geobacter sp. FeAm09]